MSSGRTSSIRSTVELTANDNTIYNFIWIDSRKGPLVLEVPPAVSLGGIDDFWYRWVGRCRHHRRRQGQRRQVSDAASRLTRAKCRQGYFVVRPSTYGNWYLSEPFSSMGRPRPGVESVKKHLKIYQLSDAANPPPVKFVNASGIPANFVAPGDYSFWTLLNQVIQEEPSGGSDPTTLGLFASIGIEKGKPFNPDERMKKILTDAANIGAVTARTIAFKAPRSRTPFSIRIARGACRSSAVTSSRVSPGVANLDGAAFFYYFATGVTPAMEEKMVGKGSQYPWTALDSNGNPFEGAKTYKLRLPPHVPVKDFWSVIVYDIQTRSMLQTDQRRPA
jgi:hypothetical protein